MKKKQKTTKISDLKKGVEKKEKTSFATQEKEMKPATQEVLKAVRTLFWIIITVILAIGVLQVVRSKQPRIIENIYRYEFNDSESELAKTFAESFVRDYLTYGSDVIEESQYNAKMNKYLVSAVDVGRPGYANGSSVVEDTMVWDIEVLDEAHSNITIKADITLTNKNQTEEKYDPETGERVKKPLQKEKTYLVSVPIFTEDGKAAVNDYPSFLAVESKLDADMETYSSAVTANDNERREIKAMLEDFYDVYYSGTAGQIKSFFKTDQNISGLNSEFFVNSIKGIQVYKEGDLYKAVVVVEIEQSEVGSIFNQRHLLEIERAEDRWVIVSLKNRGQ